MKTAFTLLVCLAALASARTQAAIPSSAVVVSCNQYIHVLDLGGARLAVVRGYDALQNLNIDASLRARPLTILGPVALDAKRRKDFGGGVVAGLVDRKNPGRAYGLLGASALKGQVVFKYSADSSAWIDPTICEVGPAFQAFAAAATRLPPLTLDSFYEYADPLLAFVCRPVGAAPTTVPHRVRAFSYEYGQSRLEILTPQEARGFQGGTGLMLFEERAADIRYYSPSRQNAISAAKPKNTQFVLSKRATLVAGKKVYAAEYFDGKGTLNLSCEVRWVAQRNVEQPVAEARRLVIAAALPVAKGTLAQAKPEYCNDATAFEILRIKYRDLMLRIPGVRQFNVGEYRAEESPLGIACLNLRIGVAESRDLAPVKARLGVTLEGHLLDFHVSGTISPL